MFKLLKYSSSALALCLLLTWATGCKESAPSGDDDPTDSTDNTIQNPTVVEFSGSCGMNVSSLIYEGDTLHGLMTFDQVVAFTSNHREGGSSPHFDYSYADMEIWNDLEFADPRDPTKTCEVAVQIHFRSPGFEVGSFPWDSTDINSGVEITLNFCQAETVKFTRMIEGTTIIERNGDLGGVGRDLKGRVKGVLESEEGARIAIDGRFDYPCM